MCQTSDTASGGPGSPLLKPSTAAVCLVFAAASLTAVFSGLMLSALLRPAGAARLLPARPDVILLLTLIAAGAQTLFVTLVLGIDYARRGRVRFAVILASALIAAAGFVLVNINDVLGPEKDTGEGLQHVLAAAVFHLLAAVIAWGAAMLLARRG